MPPGPCAWPSPIGAVPPGQAGVRPRCRTAMREHQHRGPHKQKKARSDVPYQIAMQAPSEPLPYWCCSRDTRSARASGDGRHLLLRLSHRHAGRQPAHHDSGSGSPAAVSKGPSRSIRRQRSASYMNRNPAGMTPATVRGSPLMMRVELMAFQRHLRNRRCQYSWLIRMEWARPPALLRREEALVQPQAPRPGPGTGSRSRRTPPPAPDLLSPVTVCCTVKST